MQPLAGVTKGAFELTDHTRHRVGDERGPVAGIIAIDGADQPGPGGLDEVLGGGSAAVVEPHGQPVGQAQVGHNDRSRSWGSPLTA